MQALPPPPRAETTENAIELARAWLVDGRLQCSLAPTLFPNPVTWGILLADIANHIANALEEIEGRDREGTLAGIAAAFGREMSGPTDRHTGEVVNAAKNATRPRAKATAKAKATSAPAKRQRKPATKR